MEVRYKTKKLRKQCEDPRKAQKDYGSKIGSKLTQRVGELNAATSLVDIKLNPATRLHRLEGQRANEYAVDLVHPFRLVFKPIISEDGDIKELTSIHIVKIEEVIDYHGKQKRK